jgi:cytoskeleton protein RodZ
MNEPVAPSPAPRTIGERLRAGRERAGLSVAAAAEKLHLDPKVIEALEADRFNELGASVYVRGHLRRYADFVGEPGIELVNAYSAKREASPPPRRLVTPMVGLGCALVLATAIWWVLSGSKGAPAPAPAASAATVTAPAEANPAPPPAAEPAAVQLASKSTTALPPAKSNGSALTPNAENTTNAAAEAARREEAAPARQATLRLELSSESWVEVYDSRGERLFYDVASAGSVQSIEGRPPLRVVLGNAAAVRVEVNGQTRDIPAGAVHGEGASFVVNRSGSLSRAR